MRIAVVIATALALLFTPGCKSACRQLSERQCDCIVTTIDRDACLTQAANNEGQYPPNAEQDTYCASLLNTCDCFTVNTPEGKKACAMTLP